MCRQEPGSKAAAHCQVKVSTKGNWQFSGCRLFWGVLVTARPPRALSTEGKWRPREWWASRSPSCEQTATPKPVSQTPLTRICREASAGSGAHSLAAGCTRLRCPHTGCRAPSHSLPQVGELSMPGFSMRPPPLSTQCGRLGDLFWDLLPTGPRPPCLQPNCPAFHRSQLPADPPGHCPCRPVDSGPTVALPCPMPHLVSCHLPYIVTGPLDLLSPGPETLALVLPCHPP